MQTFLALHENGVSRGSSDKLTTFSAKIVAAIAARVPSELLHSSRWASQMEKLVLPRVMLGLCLHKGKPCIGQLAAPVLLLTLNYLSSRSRGFLCYAFLLGKSCRHYKYLNPFTSSYALFTNLSKQFTDQPTVPNLSCCSFNDCSFCYCTIYFLI